MRFTPSCVLLSVTGRTMLEAGYLGIVRDHLRENGMLDQAEDLLMASGKLQVLEHKEEIESALRTPGFGGFQLLGINDFPGQGTALAGMLNAFWRPKGFLTHSSSGNSARLPFPWRVCRRSYGPATRNSRRLKVSSDRNSLRWPSSV